MADSRAIDLLASGRFPPLVDAFMNGTSLELLSPAELLAPVDPSVGDCGEAKPDRRQLAEALGQANSQYGHPGALERATRLADPKTRVVITGQQPGLFGGPLYTLSKAVAAELWAERLTAAGQPALALFWMATEDHDFRESSRATFFTREGMRTFDLGEDDEPLVPVGARQLGPRVDRVLDELRQAIPGDRFGEWVKTLGDWYRPRVRFGEAFARLLVHLLGDRCPLIVDAMLPELKSAERPWMQRIVDERVELTEAFERRDQQIIAEGYPLQVKPQPGSSPLFLEHEGKRRRIEWRGSGGFRLRGHEGFKGAIDELQEILEREPQKVSPGVRARSAVQDAVFGTCLQVLGPGELSYLPQAAPLFELLGIRAPRVALRPQILVVEERQHKNLLGSGVELADLLDPAFDLDARLAPVEDTEFVSEATQKLESLVEELLQPSLKLDTNLERPWQKTAEQMRRALEVYGNKVQAAAARRDETARARVESLRTSFFPGGAMQERVIASSHFPGKYGDRFVAAMFEQMRLDPTTLHVVTP